MHSKDLILQLISRSELEEAIARWLPMLGESDSVRWDLLAISARLNALKSDVIKGIIDFSQETLVQNQIMASMLSLLKMWQPSGDLAPLHEAVEQLSIDDNTPIEAAQLVNCNRTRNAKNFRRAFGSRKDTEHFQFYFLCGCPNEMPGSFAKRLIYNIITDHLEGREHSINFVFQEGVDRIRVEELPLGDDLEASKKRFKAYVAKRFNFTDTQSFEAFIETGIPRIETDFVTAIFEVSEKKWDGDEGEIRDYFEWMMKTFQNTHPGVPTFLFFIVVRSQNLWQENRRSSRQNAILQQLESLCNQYPNISTVLSEFMPVEAQDFADWLAELGVRNPNFAGNIIQALASTLKPEERQLFESEGLLHMKDIEIAQKMIYEKAAR